MGISDLIAGFIQDALDEANGVLELQRSDLAQRFGCVPSQINYVMSTRFSPEHGYIVESRRGGGGYIRITASADGPTDAFDACHQFHRRRAGSGRSAKAILSNLAHIRRRWTCGRRQTALLAAIGDSALRDVPREPRDAVRARVF